MQAWEWALELKTETFEFWNSDKGLAFGLGWTKSRAPRNPIARDDIRDVERLKLAIASPFYVTQEMCDLLEHATQTFPATKLRPEDLPVPTGFVLLATPHFVQDINGVQLPISAFAWGIAGAQEDPSIARGLHLSMYSRTATDPEREEVEAMWGVGFFPTLGLLHETAWQFDEDYAQYEHWRGGTKWNENKPIDPEAWASSIKMFRFMHTFFILSQQRIAEPQHTQATRPVRKRAERSLPSRPVPEVRVVTLRRYREEDAEIDPDSRGREYSHRWIVNGFWRRQWYPSEGRHKPKYIAPHVRGPKDKPLVVKQEVFLWRR